MYKQTISGQQGIYLVILFIFGSTLVMGTGGKGKNDTWLSVILAILLSIPVLLMYARILSRYPGRDLDDILEEVFGKIAGRLFGLIFTWFSFHLGALVLRIFSEFMSTVALPETPQIVNIIIFSLICVIGVKSGIETLAKCGGYFIIYAILILIIFAFLTIPNIKPDNLLPIMGNGIKPVLQGAFQSFANPFCQLVVFMMVFDSLGTQSPGYKVYIKALMIGGFFVTLVVVRNIMVLGASTFQTVYFPSYAAISRINIGNFLQRLEISVAIEFIFCCYIKISICLLAATKGVSKLFGFKDYRFIVTPVGLLMANLAYIVYDSIMEQFEWAEDIWSYYAFPFQVIFPFFIFATVEIKVWLQGRKKKSKEEAPV